MSKIILNFAVEMEGGERWEVVGDQRDVARYEQQSFYDPDKRVTAARFMAYTASVRAGKTRLSWPQFDDKCIEVGDPDGGTVEVDPTRPVPSAGIS